MKAGDDRWHEVFERDQGYCRYCGFDLLKTFNHYYFAEVDHLLSQSVPNRDELQHLVLACHACNNRLSNAQKYTTFESRKAYLQEQEHLNSGTKKKYDYYVERRRQGWN
jgi:5-methylcytosine-specific restriction endonuclease McrA